MRIAVFDYDGTIYSEKETPRLFLRNLPHDRDVKRKVVYFYLSISWMYVFYKLGLFKELMPKQVIYGITKVIKGLNLVQIDEFFSNCFTEAKEKFNPHVLLRIQQHIESGDEVLLLSGAYTHFLAIIGKYLGIKNWIGTEIELLDGICSGRVIRFVDGREKLLALQSFIRKREQEGIKYDLTESYVYGDDYRNIPIMTLVGHPVAVNPDPLLTKKAKENKWEFL